MTVPRLLAALGLALAAAAAPACAPALKTAPPLADLAGSSVPAPAEVAALLAQAAALFEKRDPAGVRDASTLALRAAAADPANDQAILLAAETLVWIADHETDPAARESAATRAVQAAQWCGRDRPPSPACSFWLGAALGVQARERPTTGASALPQIEAAFKAAAAGDPALDHAGPDRALALLYLRAPGWPVGPGDPDRGLEHARRAIALFPDHPPNLLALAEALKATGDDTGATAQAATALDLARAAAAAGVPDAGDWVKEAKVAAGRADQG